MCKERKKVVTVCVCVQREGVADRVCVYGSCVVPHWDRLLLDPGCVCMSAKKKNTWSF